VWLTALQDEVVMSVMASVAASNSAAAVAISASAESAARDAECRVVLAQFDSHEASVEAMREYADCVQRFYPDALGSSEILFFKVMVVLMLVGVFYGAYYAYKQPGYLKDGIMDYIMYPLAFGFCFPAVAAAIFFVIACSIWLFS